MEILLNVQDQVYHLSLDKNRIRIPTGLSASSAFLCELPRRPYRLKFIPLPPSPPESHASLNMPLPFPYSPFIRDEPCRSEMMDS